MNWISVEDELPVPEYEKKKSSAEVLAFDGKKIWKVSFIPLHRYDENGKLIGAYIFRIVCKNCDEGEIIKHITHWMELPEAP